MSTDELQAAYDRLGLELPAPVFTQVTESTNSDALELAKSGAPDWTVVVADEQTRGRGRLGRTWTTKPGEALLFSVILRLPSPVGPEDLGWIPLIAGLALVSATNSHELHTALKWPNDLVVEGPKKLAGVLTESDGTAIVVGVGLNVTTEVPDLPTPIATSLAIEGSTNLDRADLLAAILRAMQMRWGAWLDANGDAESAGLLSEYRDKCLTLGAAVRVELPSGEVLVGNAADIDSKGHLILERNDTGQLVTIAAGDVIHVR